MFGATWEKQTQHAKTSSSHGSLWLNQAFWLNQCKQDQTCPGLAVWSRQLKRPIVDHWQQSTFLFNLQHRSKRISPKACIWGLSVFVPFHIFLSAAAELNQSRPLRLTSKTQNLDNLEGFVAIKIKYYTSALFFISALLLKEVGMPCAVWKTKSFVRKQNICSNICACVLSSKNKQQDKNCPNNPPCPFSLPVHICEPQLCSSWFGLLEARGLKLFLLIHSGDES